MGRTLAQLASNLPDFELIGGIDRDAASSGADGYPSIATTDACAPLLTGADVVLDFSAPEALSALLDAHMDALSGRALVVGTTGLTDNVNTALESAARSCAVLVAANFSIGVNVLLALTEQAAQALPANGYDAEIVEAHHRNKVDAPSGTALALGRALAAGWKRSLDELRRDGRTGNTGVRPRGEIGMHAVRGGDVVGEHRVMFLGARERIELAHVASDRAVFAEGALLAARWITGKPAGRYAMRDVLGI
jgi:4-hydroxy-tetrahydrodipicolinate reductase